MCCHDRDMVCFNNFIQVSGLRDQNPIGLDQNPIGFW